MCPHVEGKKADTHRTDKTVEREGGTGEGKEPLRRVPLLETLTLMENTTAWLAQLVECQTAVREVKGSSPRPDQQNVLPL